jgi:translation initiation factor IF-1
MKHKKSKSQQIEKTNLSEVVLEGTVMEARPNAMFDVKLDNDQIVLCTICGKIRVNHIRILPGDRVQIGISIYDMTRGRILYRI